MTVHAPSDAWVVQRIADDLAISTGFALDRPALERLQRFIAARCRELGLRGYHEYSSVLSEQGEAERSRLIGALTITYTWFNRDAEQLKLALELLGANGRPGDPSRVWIAGAATGEEAFSLLLLAGEALPLDVLATDINEAALERARLGIYEARALEQLPPEVAARFSKTPDGRFAVPDACRQRVRFEHHNVLEAPAPCPSPRGWDLILCRNVLLYFRAEVAAAAMSALGQSLALDGSLLLGANDFIYEAPLGLRCVSVGGRLILRKETPSSTTGARDRHSSLPPRMAAVPAARTHQPSPTLSADPSPAGELAEALVCLDSGRFVEAKRLLSRVVESDPIDAEGRFLLGLGAYLSDSFSEAIAELRAALFLNDTIWPAAYYLALAYENAGQLDESHRAYQWVVEHRSLTFTPRTHSRLLAEVCAMQRDIVALSKRRAERLRRAVGPGASG